MLVCMRARLGWRGFLLASVLVTGTVVAALVVLTSDPSEGPQPPAPERVVPLEELETRAITLPRADFCELVDESFAVDALGSDVARTRHYGNGEPAQLVAGVTDVSHEFNCGYEAADGTTARAWVFVPPVTAERAERLVRSRRGTEGCSTPNRPEFGRPGVASVCSAEDRVAAAYRGLFGDAWFTCEIARPGRAVTTPAARTALLDRAETWCVRVLTSIRTND